MTSPVRILVADSSPLFRQGVKQLLASRGCRATVLEASSAMELQRFLNCYSSQARWGRLGVDLVIADRCLRGLERFAQLTQAPAGPRPPVLLMAEVTDAPFVRQAARAGIEGVINKSASPDRFFDAACSVYQGQRWSPKTEAAGAPADLLASLSKKQSLVFSRLQTGMSNKEIASDLQISQNTVKYHITQIYRKTGWTNPNRTLLASMNRPLSAALAH